ncbi:uncharacterized protein LOC122009656 [Zingiber officinale]|uniref:DEUBAD domain-containing protein n=1 Tax=Zingiber officinale TaxID=94328 RepID=A0A8J5KF08_ZINOF|nr:uncharacterized protein LOC122009656 [Zingiber officinale]KAG6487322.1 hypothetical protein ZIOFF_055908 [Zingiber officinale]
MAILKNASRVLRAADDSSPRSASSQDEDAEPSAGIGKVESYVSEASYVDSGMETDECDQLEVSEPGAQLCQVGNQNFGFPLELFDLPDLSSILSLETWNECLTEEERFVLAEYLPDMDQETFAITLKELFSGKNFQFGSPLNTFFSQLKGGLCDPKIIVYRHGLISMQRREHYHCLHRYQNSMVRSLVYMKDAFQNCAGYSIQERIQFLNMVKRQRPLERNGDIWFETNSGEGNLHHLYSRHSSKVARRFPKPSIDIKLREIGMGVEPVIFGKGKTKGVLKVTASKFPTQESFGTSAAHPSALKYGMSSKSKAKIPKLPFSGKNKYTEYHLESPSRTIHYTSEDQDDMEEEYIIPPKELKSGHRSIAASCLSRTGKNQKPVKRHSANMYSDEEEPADYSGFSHSRRKNGNVHHTVTIASYVDESPEHTGEARSFEREFLPSTTDQTQSLMLNRPIRQNKVHEDSISLDYLLKSDDLNTRINKWNIKPEYEIEKKHKRMVGKDHSSQQSFYDADYSGDMMDEHMDNMDAISKLKGSNNRTNRLENTMKFSDSQPDANFETSGLPLKGCNSSSKKPKWKVNGQYPDEPDDPRYLKPNAKQQKGKRKAVAETDSLAAVNSDQAISKMDAEDVEPKPKLQKKPFALITPTIHTGFSFSIVHLLSAVRKAMINQTEDSTFNDVHLHNRNYSPMQNIKELNDMCQTENNMHLAHSVENMVNQASLPSLTFQEIVDRVRSNPGDPCILETQEPLQDLVRGALRVFSSKTAPLGAKGWKPLVCYEKLNKSWSWTGPISSGLPDDENAEEETSSEAWGIPHKMLVKLVDAFANWLKSGQETLQQIGSLPPPPTSLLSNLDEKERFKDLRAQKSLNTIGSSSNEVRAYFRREEFLRYSVPDRAFSYTAADGRKSIVAPLKRGGGKPTSKARDHFMLKPDRPPHVTILCLVRDAAARLPGSIGTRADVCTLLRDSQYVVENVSDTQVTQVVSGALDRLHYELDPCVQFDSERKLWVYLHRDREEEDFEDDGTSSTKKWKRQRKDTADPSDTGIANDVDTGTLAVCGPSTGLDHDHNLNVGTASVGSGDTADHLNEDMDVNVENFHPLMDINTISESNGNWNALGLNLLNENRLVCQKNSTDEDYKDETFCQERPIQLNYDHIMNKKLY